MGTDSVVNTPHAKLIQSLNFVLPTPKPQKLLVYLHH